MFERKLKQNIENLSGFTLVEAIMYIAFIGVSVGLFVGFGSQMSDLRAKTSVIQDVEANGALTINFLEDYLKKSRQVLSPLTGDSTTNILVLDMPDPEENMTFSVTDGILYLAEGIADATQISGDEINIKDLSFVNTALLGQKDNIVINLDMEYRYHNSRAYEYNKQYQTSITLR
ncbi:hypothetical protein L6270_05275 [Candidatus Parcubacteria bacterium]|nr:hypothetical protein [Patescibacteria group bacterium]MBU4309371.1 hypothetical protein [Patescibacteria group bacterium]MBU4432100.1 hypothetical protein [Patescibacteria group bacterium]MBU4577732.1 hypothetical protein [Patescibacteria group bacterium]MCG2697417.1 hypothetical protein [Candidatus Parcubacteria bacterium]